MIGWRQGVPATRNPGTGAAFGPPPSGRSGRRRESCTRMATSSWYGTRICWLTFG